VAWCFDDSVRVFAELAYIRSDCGSVGNKIILLRLFFTLKRDPVCLRELSFWSENVDVEKFKMPSSEGEVFKKQLQF